MSCPYAAVFRLSPPLVAPSLTRLAFRSGQSHPVSLSQTLPSDWDRRATAPLGIRLLGRYRGARAVHGSPSDIAACHRVVLRGTHSPVNRRTTRATQVRAAPAGVQVRANQ